MNKKGTSKKKFWLWGSLLLLFIVLGIGVYLFNQITAYQHISFGHITDEELGISEPIIESPQVEKNRTEQEVAEGEPSKWNNKIFNVALFGLDRRSAIQVGRSDSIMILTVDFKHNKIKLTSLMRDLEVPIDGHGSSKLNHAYAFGGPQLAIKTINQNFGTDIRDYVAVDFFTLEAIIDAMGGVPVDVKKNEVDMVNKYMDETARIQKKEPRYLKESGMQNLNGMQAVAYSRIRSVGNGDFERTERQRRVLAALIERVREQGVSSIPSLLMKVMPHVETTLSRSDILSLAFKYFSEGTMPLEQERFPIDGLWKAGRGAGGLWIIEVNINDLKKQIEKYIFEDIPPDISKETVEEGEGNRYSCYDSKV
ncbi:LCP family protein (plasmid) [Paenibacillus thiaminolyticus]|uniref:LCP family protein n=1 Tax=Paenibacillus thiaminolyticus TaxID=49283 RepID=UPI00232FC0DB|nr:LCP family protein [Paenibacillus thiaminolyticus]WCF11619.1 LCP family protein [Paenibacillus thiaminolyticus]